MQRYVILFDSVACYKIALKQQQRFRIGGSGKFMVVYATLIFNLTRQECVA